jgi:hypothetical protein
MTQPGIPLGHTIPAHRAFGWCSHCADHTVAEELAAWQTREPIDVSPGPAAEIDRLRTANERMRHELEVMYGGAFDKLPEPAAVSAAVAPPTAPTHGLSVPHADALWDAVAIPGPHTPTYPEQHERVCRAVRDILDELTPARDETADWDALVREADRLRRDGKALHARAEELDTQLAALRQQVTEPADTAAVSRDRVAEAALAAVETALCDTLLPDAREEALARLTRVLPEVADRAAVLADVERAIRTATSSCGYKAEDGCDFCNGVDAALDQVRRMADETATEESDGAGLAALETDLADGPVRCPLCPTPLTLHTPSGARAHFTTVHPEQRITGRESGPWPLLVADETATQTPTAEPTAEDIARAHVTSLHLIGEQLATIESWFWEHLADVRDAGARQDGDQS